MSKGEEKIAISPPRLNRNEMGSVIGEKWMLGRIVGKPSVPKNPNTFWPSGWRAMVPGFDARDDHVR
jgi:hypothetical protein